MRGIGFSALKGPDIVLSGGGGGATTPDPDVIPPDWGEGGPVTDMTYEGMVSSGTANYPETDFVVSLPAHNPDDILVVVFWKISYHSAMGKPSGWTSVATRSAEANNGFYAFFGSFQAFWIKDHYGALSGETATFTNNSQAPLAGVPDALAYWEVHRFSSASRPASATAYNSYMETPETGASGNDAASISWVQGSLTPFSSGDPARSGYQLAIGLWAHYSNGAGQPLSYIGTGYKLTDETGWTSIGGPDDRELHGFLYVKPLPLVSNQARAEANGMIKIVSGETNAEYLCGLTVPLIQTWEH